MNIPNYTIEKFAEYNASIMAEPLGDTFINADTLYHYYSNYTTEQKPDYFNLIELLKDYNISIETFNDLNERVEEVLETGYTEDTVLYHQYIFNVGEDNRSPESVFYVAYDKNNKEKIPEVTDKILQIDKNGISIWEGGLSVYSDYASGWRNSLEYKPSGKADKYYGYQDEQNIGFPYIKAIDDEDYRLYSTGLNIGKFEKITFS